MMTVKLGKARGGVTIINFGPTLRSDPKARYQVFRLKHDPLNPEVQPKMLTHQEGPVPRKGRLRLRDLPRGKYMVIASGDDVAGMIHTANHVIEPPFYLTIDAEPSQKKLMEERRKVEAQRRRHKPNMLRRAINYVLNAPGR